MAQHQSANPHAEAEVVDGEDDDDADLCAPYLVEPDLSSSDYSVKPPPPSVGDPTEPDHSYLNPTSRALLTQCDEAAFKARKFYSDALARYRAQGPSPTAAPHAPTTHSNPDAPAPAPPPQPAHAASDAFKIPEAPRAMLQKLRTSPQTGTGAAIFPDSPSSQLLQEIGQVDVEEQQGRRSAEGSRRSSLAVLSPATLASPSVALMVAEGVAQKAGTEAVVSGEDKVAADSLRTPALETPVIQRIDASRDPRLRR